MRQEQVEELEKLKRENEKLSEALRGINKPANIIGNSGKMQEVYQLIHTVAPTNATVLIRGESGVGKELIAEAIHNASSRVGMPFIKVNCSALPENLIESELFGHEKGSFTGAEGLRKGRFELAEKGTIFLDEIGDLPLSTQVKLLRVLQQREFDRVGGIKTLKSDVRVIAATNRNLEELIQENKFREDLFYRINVFPIYVPPLRERRNDIPALADHFVAKFNQINGSGIKRISSCAIDLLMLYKWPGNIRELENCIERACILSTDEVIRSINLPPTLQTAESSHTERKGTLERVLEGVEKQMIIDTLTATKGNMTKAAEIMGITERILGLRIRKYEINIKLYKSLRSNKIQENEYD
jgi:Nif-specific regulatory protein